MSASNRGECMHAGKELGFWMCTALVIGNTIGIGIFVLPASLAPYGYNALIGWGITVIGMTVLARVFARLAREFPRADGPYAYIQATAGDGPAFLAIWCYWVSCWITNAAIAIGVVAYLGKVVPALDGVSPAVQAVTLIWLCVVVNTLGARMGGRVQVVTTAIKLLPMAAVILLGAWLLVTDPVAYTRNPPTTPLTLADLMAASTIALFAMLGIESAGRAGRSGARPGADHSPRHDGRHAGDGRDLPGRFFDGAAADPATGAGPVECSVRGPAEPLPGRR